MSSSSSVVTRWTEPAIVPDIVRKGLVHICVGLFTIFGLVKWLEVEEEVVSVSKIYKKRYVNLGYMDGMVEVFRNVPEKRYYFKLIEKR